MFMNVSFKNWFLAFALLLFAGCIFDDDEEGETWNAEAVCPAEGTNAYGMPNRGTFTDERDGQVYRYTTIGNQVWMAENLRYDAPYSTCCTDERLVNQYCTTIDLSCETESCCRESMCQLFGRYYSIIENGKEMGTIDGTLADTICPKGWHIPTREEWEELEKAMKVDGENGHDVANRMKHSDSVYFLMSSNPEYYPNVMLAGSDDCSMAVMSSGYLYGEKKADEIGASFLSSSQESVNFLSTYRVGQATGFWIQHYRDPVRCVMD